MEIDELFKRKQFNDTTDTKKQVSYKQAEYFNENLTQIYQDTTINVQAQTQDSSVNPEQQDATITVDTETEYANVNI